jgi:hypothetical protein
MDAIAAQEISRNIIAQLGGNQFFVMTGSKVKHYAIAVNSGNVTLTLTLTRNAVGANHLAITLNSMDTYDVQFLAVSKKSVKVVTENNGIYCDQLRGLFESTTGIRTSLTHIYSI